MLDARIHQIHELVCSCMIKVRAISLTGNPRRKQIYLSDLPPCKIKFKMFVCIQTHTCVYMYICMYTHSHTVTSINTHSLPHCTEHRELFREGKSVILWKLNKEIGAKKIYAVVISSKDSQLLSETEIERQAGWRRFHVCCVFQTSLSEASKRLPGSSKWWPPAWPWPKCQCTHSRSLRWLKDGPLRPREVLPFGDFWGCWFFF